ncbi:MAG: hypothetical protein DIU63_02185 [Proteobacteria bacterium]|jgi:Small-conductance mechanosensitive channel|nr:MAG: hypothetical protein DIU63_02185 [Pseudomonadota bacterium]
MLKYKARQMRLTLIVIGALMASLIFPIAAIASETAQPEAQPATSEAAPQTPPAEPLLPQELAQRVNRLVSDVESAAKAIDRVKDRDSGLAEQRGQLERLEVEAEQLVEELRPWLRTVGTQLQQLGPPPPKDAPPEAPAIANERLRLTAAQAEIEGAIKTTELSRVRARQLIESIQTLRQALFKRDLLRFSGSPLSPSTWQALDFPLRSSARQIQRLANDWWGVISGRWLELLILLAGAALIYVAVGRWIVPTLRRLLQPRIHGTAEYFPQAGDAFWEIVGRGSPPILATAFLFAGMDAWGLMTAIARQFSSCVFESVVFYCGTMAVARAALKAESTRAPRVDIADVSASKLLRWVKLFAALSAFDIVTGSAVRLLYLPVEIDAARVVLTNLTFAGLLIALVRIPLARRAIGLLELPPRWYPRWLKVPIAMVALAIAGTTVVGYVALGRFISEEVTLIGAVALVLLTAHLVIRRFAVVLTQGERHVGRVLETRFGIDHERMSYVARVIVVGLELLLALATLPVVLLTWGYSGADVLDWLRLLIVGFEVGQYRVSLVRILVALLLFLFLIFATRAIQRWLDRSVLSAARVDRSISHSVLTGVGYAGTAIAIVVGLSYAGLDFTQLAIVAGALSVGIGFGLQAIFNNFVSGIILLIERPIKVGDWIIVNGQEGHVRRINVRATEIETFDRSSIIIPNSVLITSAVTNWTHRSLMGRLVIRVAVTYQADPEQVVSLLKRVAEESGLLLREPAPSVVFEDFGSAGQIFSLRAFVPDVTRRGSVQTQLRLAISKAFKEANIEFARG